MPNPPKTATAAQPTPKPTAWPVDRPDELEEEGSVGPSATAAGARVGSVIAAGALSSPSAAGCGVASSDGFPPVEGLIVGSSPTSGEGLGVAGATLIGLSAHSTMPCLVGGWVVRWGWRRDKEGKGASCVSEEVFLWYFRPQSTECQTSVD